jgi:hypothetical protein
MARNTTNVPQVPEFDATTALSSGTVTPHVATAEEQAAAERAYENANDKFLTDFPIKAVFDAALSDQTTADTAKSTATQRMGAAAMAEFCRMVAAGEPGFSYDVFWRLSQSSGDQYYNSKLRSALTNKLLADMGYGTTSYVDENGKQVTRDVQQRIKKKAAALRTLIGRGIDDAVDICCAGGSGMVHLSPAHVLRWFDIKLGVFFVSPTCIVHEDHAPLGHLLTLTATKGKVRDALVKKYAGKVRLLDGEPLLALNGEIWSVNVPGEEPLDIQCNVQRIRELADSKRYTMEDAWVKNRKGAMVKTKVKRLIEHAKRDRASDKKDDATAPATPATPATTPADGGRPEGTTGSPGASLPSMRQSLRDAVTNIAEIMKADVKKDNGPDNYWSTNPDRELIQTAIDLLVRYKADAEAFELAHKMATTQAKEERDAAARKARNAKDAAAANAAITS